MAFTSATGSQPQSPTFQLLISAFREWQQTMGFTPGTIREMTTNIVEFLACMESQHQIFELYPIEPVHILGHYDYLSQRPNRLFEGGLSSQTLSHHVSAIKIFYGWLEENGRVKRNPIGGLSFPKPTKREREILTLPEVKKLYEACENLTEKVVLHLYYGCGLRRSEGESLNVKDVFPEAKLLIVRSGKLGKRREIPLSGSIARDFQTYLQNRATPPEETAFLLSLSTNQRMRGVEALSIVKRLIGRAEIEKNVGLHSLRHSIATHLLESGMKLERVQEYLGHACIDTTQIYARFQSHRLKEIFR